MRGQFHIQHPNSEEAPKKISLIGAAANNGSITCAFLTPIKEDKSIKSIIHELWARWSSGVCHPFNESKPRAWMWVKHLAQEGRSIIYESCYIGDGQAREIINGSCAKARSIIYALLFGWKNEIQECIWIMHFPRDEVQTFLTYLMKRKQGMNIILESCARWSPIRYYVVNEDKKTRIDFMPESCARGKVSDILIVQVCRRLERKHHV